MKGATRQYVYLIGGSQVDLSYTYMHQKNNNLHPPIIPPNAIRQKLSQHSSSLLQKYFPELSHPTPAAAPSFISPLPCKKRKNNDNSNLPIQKKLKCLGIPHQLLQKKGCDLDCSRLMKCYNWINNHWHHKNCLLFFDSSDNKTVCDRCNGGRSSIRKANFPNLFGLIPDLMEDLPSKEKITQRFERNVVNHNCLYFPNITKYTSILKLIDCKSIEFSFNQQQYTATICETCNISPAVEKTINT